MDFAFQSVGFIGFLERYGSVRLVNCLKASFDEGTFPYEHYSDLLRDSEQRRVSRLGRIRNLGRKTIDEFFQLTRRYEVSEENAAAQHPVASEDAEASESKADASFRHVMNVALDDELVLDYLEKHLRPDLLVKYRNAVNHKRVPYRSIHGLLSDSQADRVAAIGSSLSIRPSDVLEILVAIVQYVNLLNRNNNSLDVDPSDRVVKFNKQELFSCLNDREINIIELRYGFNGGKPETLQTISEKFDVTRERIRQIESKAIRKLKFDRDAWLNYLTINQENILAEVFDGKYFTAKPSPLVGVSRLAIDIVDGKLRKYLDRVATPYRGGWVRSSVEMAEVEEVIGYFKSHLPKEKAGTLPIDIETIAAEGDWSTEAVKAALSAQTAYSEYRGYLVEGTVSARKRRIVNIISLFESQTIPSPCTLWDLKRAYWFSHEEDRCSARDLVICLEKHSTHFLNLRELGWVFLKNEDCVVRPDVIHSHVQEMDAFEDESDFEVPVIGGEGLVNRIYEMFLTEGPMRLKDAANAFQSRFPQYSRASFFPMLVVFAVFFKFAPGIIGIQSHRRNPDRVREARQLALDNRQVELYLLAKCSAPPLISFPLWDVHMEKDWGEWLFNNENLELLGHLLYYADLDNWPISESEQRWWKQHKQQLAKPIASPAAKRFEIRQVNPNDIFIALAVARVFGQTNWMQMNHGLGWRIETTRVVLILALLVHAGALRPTGDWYQAHQITPRGQELFKEMVAAVGQGEPTAAHHDLLLAYIPSAQELGWAREYEASHLVDRIAFESSTGEHKAVPPDTEDEDIDLDELLGNVSLGSLDKFLEEDDE